MEETGVSGEHHKPVGVHCHWQTLSHNVVSSTPAMSGGRAHNLCGDKH